MSVILGCNFKHPVYEKKRPKNKSGTQHSQWLLSLTQLGNEYDEYLFKEHLEPLIRKYRVDYNRLVIHLKKHEHTDWLNNVNELRNRLQNQTLIFPEDLQSFIKKSNLPNDTMEKITLVKQRVEEFLNSQNQKCRIKLELSEYPEEDESEEIKIKIEINNDLDYIYNHLKLPIYKIAVNSLPKETLQKILIKFEPI